MFKDGLGVRGVFWGHLSCGFWRDGRTIDEFGVRYKVSVAHTINLCGGVMKKSFNHSSFLLFTCPVEIPNVLASRLLSNSMSSFHVSVRAT